MQIFRPKSFLQWVVCCLALLFAFTVLLNWGKPTPSREFDESDALAACQSAISRAVYDPERASIPIVVNQAPSGIFRFEWNQGTRMLRLRNRLGLDAAAIGSCAVDRASRRIIHLTIDDRAIL